MKHLVIGLGEVGKAIQEVLAERYQVDGIDKESKPLTGPYNVLHVCFPYFNKFVSTVKEYQEKFAGPKTLTIIHSTTPVGVSAQCSAVHSPIRGIHPHLTSGVKTFMKYFGGPDAEVAAKIFSDLGIKTKTSPKAENTEALKIWDTTIYGWNIMLEKEIYAYCEKHGLDFELVYRDASRSYNEGYAALGRPEFTKYVLKNVPGKIGGHCVMSNCDFLDSDIARILKEKNKNY